MRLSVLALGAALAFGVLIQPAGAAPVTAVATIEPSSNIIQVDRRCGEHSHYVPRHRNRAGHLVRGRCVVDRRDRY